MSEEINCECCRELWYEDNIKNGLCPNCYDYFKQLKQQLEEKDKEISKLKASCQQIKTQLAIQELEKVKDRIKHFCDIHSDEYYGVKSQVKGIEQDVCEEIDNQIKNLENL